MKTKQPKLRYAVVYDDENWIETGYYDTESEAIEEFKKISDDESWPQESHSVQGFTDEQIREIEDYSEAHPQ